MSEVFVKKDTVKVDPKNPKSDPAYAYAEAKAEQLMKKRGIKYGEVNEEKGFGEDYWKKVKGNPNNVPGAPAFFPEIKIRSAMSDRIIYTCSHCDAVLESYAQSFEGCPECGYRTLHCKSGGHPLYAKLIQEEGIWYCLSCGTKYSTEEHEALMETQFVTKF